SSLAGDSTLVARPIIASCTCTRRAAQRSRRRLLCVLSGPMASHPSSALAFPRGFTSGCAPPLVLFDQMLAGLDTVVLQLLAECAYQSRDHRCYLGSHCIFEIALVPCQLAGMAVARLAQHRVFLGVQPNRQHAPVAAYKALACGREEQVHVGVRRVAVG